MPNLGTTEIIIIAIVIMVLFGSKKLPGAARSLGQSMRIFKAETKGLRDDDTRPTTDQGGHVALSPPVAPAAPTAVTATPVVTAEAPRDSTQA